MSSTPPSLVASPPQMLPDLLTGAVNDPALMISFSTEISALDPLEHADVLSRLRQDVRAATRLLRDGKAGETTARVASLVLERITARQTPVAAAMHALLRHEPQRFTPALLRMLFLTARRDLADDEIRKQHDDASAAFLTGELTRVGVVARTSADADGHQALGYRLTPAGRHALKPIARQVLEAELGRFPWPPAAAWAAENEATLFPLLHDGEDGATIARCLEWDPADLASLSVPNLYAVARPTLYVETALQALAVLRGTVDTWTSAQVRAGLARILDDYSTLTDRTAPGADMAHRPKRPLVLFATQDVRDRDEDEVTEFCASAGVECEVVA